MKGDWFGKILTCLAIALAVFFGIYNAIEIWKNLLICTSIMIVLIVVFAVIEHVANCEGDFLGRFRYFSTKDRTKDYTILSREVALEFQNEENATYISNVHLKMKRTVTDFIYVSRYRWAKQANDIITETTSPDDSQISKIEFITNWTYLNIEHRKTLTKGSVWDTGFALKNLQITDYKTQSFLCFKITEKIKTVKLIAKLPAEKYGSKKATFYVWDASDQPIGKDIQLEYDSSVGGYVYQINYPQLGRSYVIDWD